MYLMFQACKQQMDGVILLFSFTDKSSFNDLPHHMTRLLITNEDVCKFVIGTKYPFFHNQGRPKVFQPLNECCI